MLSRRSSVCKGPGVTAAALSPFPGCLALLQPRAPRVCPPAEDVPGHSAASSQHVVLPWQGGGHGSRAADA